MDPRPSLDQSIQCFEMALKAGTTFSSHYGVANAALMRGQWETDHRLNGALAALNQAEGAYRQARQLSPHHSIVASNLVEVALWKGRALGFGTAEGRRALEAGEAEFQESVKRFPKVSMLLLRGAQLAEVRGLAGDAKARVKRAFALDPHNPEIRLMLKKVQRKG
jgi:hypothetical protein